MEIELKTNIQYLKGVGPKMAEKLKRLSIVQVADLIYYWPRTYRDYTNITTIGNIGKRHPKHDLGSSYYSVDPCPDVSGEDDNKNVVLKARVIGISNKMTPRKRMKITEAVIEDGTGSIKLVWFNQPFLKDVLRPGSEWIFHGKVAMDSFARELIMESPERVKIPCIVPVYPETRGITSTYIWRLISNIKDKISKTGDHLPEEIVGRHELLSLNQALEKIHFPNNWQDIEQARERLAFDELFLIALRSRLLKRKMTQDQAPQITIDDETVARFKSILPYTLTNDQERALADILTDLGTVPSVARGLSPVVRPMNRLLNGDVGSGKTVIAAIAAQLVVKAGYRVVLMVPTEILATQHYRTFCDLLNNDDVSIGLLTSVTKKINQKADPNNQLLTASPQSADIVIGTQALLQKKVNLKNIGLVIIDEQHRFGVAQRAALRQFSVSSSQFSVDDPISNGEKLKTAPEGSRSEKLPKGSAFGGKTGNLQEMVPHFLSMTATPIPRTLYLALFGDLDVSVIKEKPANRKEIKTRLVEPHNREKAYDFIRHQVGAGRQVFVVCPLIEEGMQPETWSMKQSLFDEERKSVVKEYEKLSKHIFSEFRVAMLHGKMKTREKESILTGFSRHEYDILVSTSVIEVGIDVPNAAVMMIEDAERFGLAQIHQFRGRVGRSDIQSFCFLFTNSRSEKVMRRLKSVEETSDGFKLAEVDLTERGPGDILGTLQSGELELKMASFSDKMLIEQAAESADQILDNLSKYPKLQEKIEELESVTHHE